MTFPPPNLLPWDLFTTTRGLLEEGISRRKNVEWSCADIAPGVYLARVLLDGREIEKLKIAVAR